MHRSHASGAIKAAPDTLAHRRATKPLHSPGLQPAERLWPLVDEPVANGHFGTIADLEAALAERRTRHEADTIRPRTDCHRWPRPTEPK